MVHQDRVAQAAEHDAAERRLTELYLKAVEQLGSAQAAVRHGGLYALERVAQDNPSQRQTVVDVICAYLRNPYTLPPATSGPRPLGVRRPLLRSTTVHRALTSFPGAGNAREERLQEREVRLTAQRVLRGHLRPGGDPDQPDHTFWPGINLDLTGATLIKFRLDGCQVDTANFDGATFVGGGLFSGTSFTNVAVFYEASFTGDPSFYGAYFAGPAVFNRASFARHVFFSNASFGSDATFDEATFAGDAFFGHAHFADIGAFHAAVFTGVADFTEVSFALKPWFNEVSFHGKTTFDGATKAGVAFNPVEREQQPGEKGPGLAGH
jgi:hypothetical protein